MRQLGFFFLVAVGTEAGGNLMATLQFGGLKFLLTGVVITVLPMLVAMVVGIYVYKINLLIMLGALTGAVTSTPARSVVEPMSESKRPKNAYAAVYPFALDLVIICPQILGLL